MATGEERAAPGWGAGDSGRGALAREHGRAADGEGVRATPTPHAAVAVAQVRADV